MKIKINKRNKKRIADKLKDCNYNVRAYYLVIDPDVQKYRTIEEIIILIDALKKHNFNKFVYDLARDHDVQKYRTIEEIIILMEELEKCDYSDETYYLAVDHNIQESRPIEEIIKLMENQKLKKQKKENTDIKMNTKVFKYIQKKEEK